MGWYWNKNEVVGGGGEVGIQIGWLGSLGKERGRWNTNRVAVVARGAVEGGGEGVGIQIGWWGPAGEV